MKKCILIIIITLLTFACTKSTNKHGDSLNNNWVEIKWYDYPDSPKAILQIPISLEGIDQEQYLQLDTGCPESILFGYQFSKLIKESDPRNNDDEIFFNGSIGSHKFTNFKFELKKNFGKDRADQGQEKIGILGTDFFKDKILIIDFLTNRILISTDLGIIDKMAYKFKFIPTRKHSVNFIVISISLNDRIIDEVLYDTGSSSYTLKLLKRRDWEQYVGKADMQKLEKHSIRTPWGKHFNYSYPIKGELQVGDFVHNDPIITFEDTDLYDDSKLNGVLGNRPFFNSCIVLDFRNSQFGVSK